MKQLNERKKQWLIGFVATWIAGFWAHGYHILNLQPNHDCILYFKGVGNALSHGRWFLGIASALSGEYNMPWLIGLLSFTYLGIATIVIWEVLELKKTLSIVLIGIMLVVFPAVTAAFSFMFIADGHMLAFLMACVAVWITKKYRWGCVPGAIILCLALGTYQAELSIVVILVLLLAIRRLLIDGYSFKAMCRNLWKQGITILGGLVLYFCVTKVVNSILGVELSSYQGIDEMHLLNGREFARNMYKAIAGFISFLGVDTFPHMSFYGWLNVVVLATSVVFSMIIMIKGKLYKRPVELLMTFICALLIPFSCYIVLFVSTEVQYTVTMLMGICFIYILLIMLAENISIAHLRFKNIMVSTVLLLLAFHFIQDDNIAYFYLDLSYERTYSACTNILGRIDQLENVPQKAPVAIVGNYASQGESHMEDMTPYISGVITDTMLYYDYHYTAMWDYYFGRHFELATQEEKANIEQTTEFENMPAYPAEGAIRVIDNCIVVKLSGE